MNGYPGVFNIFEDALVGGWFASLVMLGLKTVDGHDDVELFELLPGFGDDAEGAGNDLGVHTAALDLGQKQFQFAVTNERVAANEGDVERLMLVNDGKHLCD